MSYTRHRILQAITGQLRTKPGMTRTQMALVLGIDRHTMIRATSELDQSFESIQSSVRNDILASLGVQGRILSTKELVRALGFGSYRAFARWQGSRR
jgi:hypothetical protein